MEFPDPPNHIGQNLPSNDNTLFRHWKDIQDYMNNYQYQDEISQKQKEKGRQAEYKRQLDLFQNNKHEMLLQQKEQDR